MKNAILLFSLILCLCSATAQEGFVFNKGINKDKIAFDQYSNLIVLPVTVNDVEFNFMLDTGAARTIIFNLKGIDSLSIKEGKYISVNGYGSNDALSAYYSTGNKIEVGDFISDTHADVLVLSDSEIDISPKLDIEIHGILGVDFLENFVTHIDYRSSFLKVYENLEDLPSSLKKAKQFPITIYNSRMFVNIGLDNRLVKDDFKLLLDSGSGDALWIFDDIDDTRTIENSFEDYLGFGINGDIFGLRTKVDAVHLFNSTLRNVAVSYPFKKYQNTEHAYVSHDGSIGGEVLRRFHVVIDYPRSKIIMKPNKSFKEGFYYNMTGLGVKKGELELFTLLDRDFTNRNVDGSSSQITLTSKTRMTYKYVPKIYVDYLREGSPAHKAGIQVGDQIISVNGRKKKQLTLNNVSELFFKNPYQKLKMKLKRGETVFNVKIINIPLIR
ncbi:aspartyl protease family protein [uncultured Nonlabens sp.]|uniref:aspartyl protease family protein n=1 Tax=uncultured Nonlabens sp. TaxID=859306 RepID=UPI00260BEDA6|nr:aspartyl protease family protein [uncultured Nonlabens sp.]